MNWIIDRNRPICPQICEQICVAIAKNELLPREKIYSVRELALKLGVNPNTVQKSYDILEEKGVIFSVRGSGWFVNEETNVANEVVKKVIEDKIYSFLQEMKQLGIDNMMLKKYLEDKEGK